MSARQNTGNRNETESINPFNYQLSQEALHGPAEPERTVEEDFIFPFANSSVPRPEIAPTVNQNYSQPDFSVNNRASPDATGEELARRAAAIRGDNMFRLLCRIHVFIFLVSLAGIMILDLSGTASTLIFTFILLFFIDVLWEIKSWNPDITLPDKFDFFGERIAILSSLLLLCLTFMINSSNKILSIVPYAFYIVYRALTTCRDSSQYRLIDGLLPSMIVVEAAMILSKIDGYNSSSWSSCLAVNWIFAVFCVGFTCMGFLGVFIHLWNLRSHEEDYENLRTVVFITVDLLLITLYQIFLNLGLVNYFDNNDKSTLNSGLALGLVSGIVGQLLLSLVKTNLIKHLSMEDRLPQIMANNDDNDEEEDQSVGPVPEQRREREGSTVFRTSEVKAVLTRISSTYFRLFKTMDLVSNAAKPHVEDSKSQQSPGLGESFDKFQHSRDVTKSVVHPDRVVNITNNLSNVEINEESRQVEPQGRELLAVPVPIHNRRIQRSERLRSEAADEIVGRLKSARAAFFEGDQNAVKNSARESQDEDMDNQGEPSRLKCVICFTGERDCVFMPCGHGGLCNDCAKDIWLKRQHCFLCRHSIEEILQIDLGTMRGAQPIQVLGSTRLVHLNDRF